MGTTTRTQTFTVVDIRRVVENFAADFAMIAQATGLRSRDSVASTVDDLRLFAELGYLDAISVFLVNAQGQQVRAAKYVVSKSAIGWQSQMPGNNLWPRLLTAQLRVVATFGDDWWLKTPAEKDKIRRTFGIQGTWDQTTTDTSFRHLAASVDRRYASNGYGMERSSYQ